MAFKEKNTSFNVGYIPKQGKDELKLLESFDEVDVAFSQYVLNDLDLQYKDQEISLEELYPMPIALENLSYGRMPFRDADEIAMSAIFSKKLTEDIGSLIGQVIHFQGRDLKISGIYNAPYDAVIFSSDIELELYKDALGEPYSTYYTVFDFRDVATVSQKITAETIEHSSAADQVNAILSALNQIQFIFTVLSIIILGIALVIGLALLAQYQSSKVKEMGLYQALGFNRRSVQVIVLAETLLVALLSVVILVVGIIIASVIIPWAIPSSSIVLAVTGTFALILISSLLMASRAITMDPSLH